MKHKFSKEVLEMRRILVILMVCVAMFFIFPKVVHAGKDIVIKVDGKNISFPSEKPFVDKSKNTMIPLRIVSQNMGYRILLNLKTGETIVYNAKTKVVLKNGSNVIRVNGKVQKMDTKMILKNGWSFVPLRFVTQVFGAKVTVNAKTNQIDIKTKLNVPIVDNIVGIVQSNQKAFAVTGKGEAYATVEYVIKDTKNKMGKGYVKANEKGMFRIAVDARYLLDGKITVELLQKKDGLSSEKIVRNTTKDVIGPTVSMSELRNIYANNQSSYAVNGIAEEGSQLTMEAIDREGKKIRKQVFVGREGLYYAVFDLTELKNGSVQMYLSAKDTKGNTGTVIQKTIQKDDAVYELDAVEQEKWNVYNDGTHPIETTKGINDALKWANENQKTTFKMPKGTYLIAKGVGEADTNARINMVSNMTFSLDKETVIQKEANKWEMYNTLFLGEKVRNVTIQGGIYRGDKETHDYSGRYAPSSGGTHEWGLGIEVKGAENVVIDGVKTEKFTGDGIATGGATIAGSFINPQDVEVGSLDDEGNPISAMGKVRTNNRKVTHFDNPAYQTYRNIYFWVPQGMTSNKVDIYYYRKDGSFISVDKQKKFYFEESIIPEGADYFRAVFDAPSPTGVSIQRMTIANSKHIVIKNSDMGYNRRQGITAGGEHVLIENNNIHDIGGIPPGSGIDIEPGFMPAIDINIKNNNFDRNHINMVLAYGKDSIIDGNTFGWGGPGSVGVKIWEGYIGNIEIKNNTFKGSGLDVSAKSLVTNNTFIEGMASFNGDDVVVDGIKGVDSSIGFGTKTPMGVTASNIDLTMTGKLSAGVSVENAPVYVKNLTIKGPSNGKVLGGNAANGSIFDNLQIIGYNSQKGFSFPRGTYNNCVIQASTENTNIYGPGISNSGKFEFHNCSFQTTRSALIVHNVDADVTIDNSNFEILNPTGYSLGFIDVQKAKHVSLTNSIFHAEKNTDKGYNLIRIGVAGWQSGPVNVGSVVINGNTFYASVPANGINTLDGGVDAEPYDIRNNTLNGTVMKLREKDMNLNNQ